MSNKKLINLFVYDTESEYININNYINELEINSYIDNSFNIDVSNLNNSDPNINPIYIKK